MKKIPFMPTILEHTAGIVGISPSMAARDASKMAQAHIAAYELYGHDAVTIGIDIYNIEAEALGCEVRYHDDFSIPGIVTHPLASEFSLKEIVFSTDKGRITDVLEAIDKVNGKIGRETRVGAAICGPFSIAVELYGYVNVGSVKNLC